MALDLTFALLTVPSGWITQKMSMLPESEALVLELLLVAVLHAREVGLDHLVDLLLRQRAVGVAAARAEADRHLVLAALGELRSAPAAVRAAPAGVEVPGAVDVPVAGAAAARSRAAGGEAPRAVPDDHLGAGHPGHRLLDVVALREQLGEPRAGGLVAPDDAEDADLLDLLAQDVFLPLGDDGVLGGGVVAADAAGLLLGALGLPFLLGRLLGLLLFLLLDLFLLELDGRRGLDLGHPLGVERQRRPRLRLLPHDVEEKRQRAQHDAGADGDLHHLRIADARPRDDVGRIDPADLDPQVAAVGEDQLGLVAAGEVDVARGDVGDRRGDPAQRQLSLEQPRRGEGRSRRAAAAAAGTCSSPRPRGVAKVARFDGPTVILRRRDSRRYPMIWPRQIIATCSIACAVTGRGAVRRRTGWGPGGGGGIAWEWVVAKGSPICLRQRLLSSALWPSSFMNERLSGADISSSSLTRFKKYKSCGVFSFPSTSIAPKV